jgi:hypothetical protein
MMNGITIQELACPRCAIQRTVRYSGASFCFNCRLQWSGVFIATTQPPYMFTVAEIARLAIYRSAIRAGFYTDR